MQSAKAEKKDKKGKEAEQKKALLDKHKKDSNLEERFLDDAVYWLDSPDKDKDLELLNAFVVAIAVQA